MSAIEKSIVTVKATFLCLVHALNIAMGKVNGDPKYKSYRNGRCLKHAVQYLLSAFGDKLTNSRGSKELEQFQNYLWNYKIIVYDGLSSDGDIFSGNYISNKKLYLLYDSGHYNVITNLKAAILKRYICNACDTLYEKTHKCDRARFMCTATPPCLNIGRSIVLHAKVVSE